MFFETIANLITTYWGFLLIALILGIVTGWLAADAEASN